MKRSRLSGIAVLGLASVTALTACSGTGSNGSSGSTKQEKVTTSRGEGKTVTVWVMEGDYSDESLKAINNEFERTGAAVDLQVQSWDGIATKITTALATSTPPDVLDLGNTQIASFAANGGLMDLTRYRDDLRQGQTWLDGLVDPATVDGRLYAVPGFAGARAVIYNKKTWAEAGVTKAPTTFAELTAALKKVRAANPAPDFSPLYMPGQNWYAGMQFVWDAGGDIATRKGDKWVAGLGSDEAQKGLADFKAFQNEFSSKASRTLDALNPDQTQVIADGKASAIVATSGFVGLIQKANPKLKDGDLGTFPFPGKSGRTQPVMLGGSDWGIAARSRNAELAVQWTRIAAGPGMQSKWIVGHDGWIPNSTEGTRAAGSTVGPVNKSFFDAALNSKATPASADWAQIESTKEINELFASIASGTKSPEGAAKSFDAVTGKALNAGH